MSRMKITKTCRGVSNLLTLHMYGLEVSFNSCSFLAEAVLLKQSKKIVGKIIWTSEKQELRFRELLNQLSSMRRDEKWQN